MKSNASSPLMDQLIDPLGRCLTPESARKILKLRASARLQTKMARLAEKCNEGSLSEREHAEYANYVSFGTFVALLKSKARQLLANSSGD